MNDIDTQNEVWIMGAWEDFDMFLAQKSYTDAGIVIDNVSENGFSSDAMRMRHVLGRTLAHISNNAEDEAIGHEDPRDVADRRYPNE